MKTAIKKSKGAAPKDSKYLLRISEDLRREIRIEALTQGIDMSSYICSILMKRPRSRFKK